MITFTLLSRTYCHLCDDMLHALEAFQRDHAFAIKVVDVDQVPELVAQYDELVPVLLGSKRGAEPRQLCNYFLDSARLKAFLDE
jgi:thiol-disulfide isomerase/thioredoxin